MLTRSEIRVIGAIRNLAEDACRVLSQEREDRVAFDNLMEQAYDLVLKQVAKRRQKYVPPIGDD